MEAGVGGGERELSHVFCWWQAFSTAEAALFPSVPAKWAWCSGSAAFARFSGLACTSACLADPAGDSRVEPGRVRGLEVGFQGGTDSQGEPLRWEASHGRTEDSGDALILTGDGQFLEVTATLHYAIDTNRPGAIRRFVLELADPEAALQALAESSVRKVVSRRKLVELLTTDRREAEEAATRLLREQAGAIDLGVVVQGITFQDVHPPLAVVDSYRDVSRAESDRQRRINEAATYKTEKLLGAEARPRSHETWPRPRRQAACPVIGRGRRLRLPAFRT